MKKILFKVLFTVSFFTFVNTIKAQTCSLDQVGAVNYSTTAQLSDMAVAPGGTVYVASYSSATNKISLHSAVTAGSWSLLASISTSTTVKPIVRVRNDGRVYVAIRNEANGKVGELYYLSGGSLLQLGTSFSGSNVVSDLSIAFNSIGEEYVAYTDATNSNVSTVKKWSGSAWLAVGAGTVSTGPGHYNSLEIDKTDSPVLAFQDMSIGYKTTISKYAAGSWSSKGTLGTSTTSNIKIKIASNGDYYVGYTDNSGNAIVQFYNGSSWSALGSPLSGLSFNADAFDLELDAVDVPFIIGIYNTSFYAVSFKYLAPSWVNTSGGNLNTTTSVNTNIDFDGKGNPYFFYVDQTGNNGLNVKTLTSPISIATQPTSVSICNGNSGLFNIGVTGGTPSYQWQIASSGSFTNPGVYYSGATTSALSFTANSSLDQNKVRCVVNVGCKNVISNAVNLTVSSPSISISFTNPLCAGGNSGIVNSLVSGGITPYTYTWSSGESTPNISSKPAGTYSLTISDAIGCKKGQGMSLLDPSAITTSFSGNQTICSGGSTTLTLTVAGGQPGYTYVWSPGGSLNTTTIPVVTANPSSTQTYTVTVTDANLCTATNTVMVTVNTLPTLAPAASSSICAGNSAVLSVTGTANSYTWNPGALIGTTQTIFPSATTIYTVVGTNTVNGCQASATTTVTVNTLPTSSAGPSRTLTCANTSTTLSGSTVGGVTFNWSGPGIIGGGGTLTPTINVAGLYSFYVTSSAGCVSSTSTVSVTQNTIIPSPTASNSATLTCLTTTVSLTGSPSTGVNYQWSGPGFSGGTTSQNAVANAAGTFTLKVTDAVNGCTNTAVTTVSQNTTAPVPSASNTSTLNCLTTTVALTGAPSTGVTYQWSGAAFSGGTTSQNANAIAPGIYTLAVTNTVNGCVAYATTAVNQNTVVPVATAIASGSLTCSSFTVGLTGGPSTGVNYQWSGPGFSGGTISQNAVATSAGSYTLLVTNVANNCSNTAVASVTQNTTAPVPSASNTSTLNCLTTTVALTGAPSTGVAYQWTGSGFSGGTTSQNATAIASGIYTLVVTNTVNGCAASATTAVTQNTTTPTLTVSGSQTITCLSPTVSLNGASVPSTCTPVWSGGVTSGANSFAAVASSANIYTLTITNPANGCSNSAAVNVFQNTFGPSLSSNSSGTLTCSNTTVNAIASTTVSPVTYTWSGTGILSGASTPTISVNASGIKSFTITNTVNGCINSGTISVTQNTIAPLVTGVVSGTLTCSNPTVNAISATGALASYNWSGAGILSGAATSTITVNQAGIYSYTVTDLSNGCSSNGTRIVSQNTIAPTGVSAGSNQTLTCAVPSVTLTGSVSSPTNAAINWLGGVCGSPSNIITTACTAGVYTLTTSDLITGCSSTSTVEVLANASIPFASLSSNTKAITCANTTVSVTASASMTPVSYNWTPTIGIVPGTETTASPVFNSPGSYSLVVTNTLSGCSSNISSNVVTVFLDNSAPSISLAANSSTLTCTNTTVVITPTVTPASVVYSWSGFGIVSGSSSQNVSVNQPGIYTITVTNTVNSCVSTNSTSVFADNILPSLNVNASSSFICSGNSTTLTALSGSDPNTIYSWTPGVLNGASQTVSPVANTVYTAVVTNTNNGCVNTGTINISVGTSPILSITGNTNICKGSTSTLVGSGATSYTWNSGANTNTVNVTPTVTTTYTLNGSNGGCTSYITTTVSIIPNKTINGVISNTAGATGGNVILYKYTSILHKWDSITVSPLTSSYTFANIDSALYVVRAIPTATNIQSTYGASSISWQNATVINHGCTNNSVQNISLIGLVPYTTGPGTISGVVTQANGFGHRMYNENRPLAPGNPIGGIIVKGGRNPGGQMLVQTITNSSGQYTLTGLPISNNNDNLFVLVDIPGLDTNGTYHRIITTNVNQFVNLNFTIDSIYINPTGNVTAISQEISVVNHTIVMYPNPANQYVSIQYELIESAMVQIDLYDMLGNKVKNISPLLLHEKNKYKHVIDLEKLSTGIYFIKMNINNSESVLKLVVTE